MDVERIRSFLLGLPNVAETMQWGDNLVFWAGDKAIGGKMFALANLDARSPAVIAFCAGQERYSGLLEHEGIFPAPYLARAYWVAVERWDVFRPAEWKSELTAAHAIVATRLPRKTRDILTLPLREQKRIIAQRRGHPGRAEQEESLTAEEALQRLWLLSVFCRCLPWMTAPKWCQCA